MYNTAKRFGILNTQFNEIFHTVIKRKKETQE